MKTARVASDALRAVMKNKYMFINPFGCMVEWFDSLGECEKKARNLKLESRGICIFECVSEVPAYRPEEDAADIPMECMASL